MAMREDIKPYEMSMHRIQHVTLHTNFAYFVMSGLQEPYLHLPLLHTDAPPAAASVERTVAPRAAFLVV